MQILLGCELATQLKHLALDQLEVIRLLMPTI